MSWIKSRYLILAAILVLLLLVYCYTVRCWFSTDRLTRLEEFFKIIGYFAAAIFLIYKAVTGYFIVNLSVSMVCTRQHQNNSGNDYLQVAINLIKGDRSSILLHDIRVKFTWNNYSHIEVIQGIDRLSFSEYLKDNKDGRRTIRFDKVSIEQPFLRLSAGETTQFACHINNLPKNEVCTVEAVILAKKNAIFRFLRRKPYGMGQWRCSAISFPLLKE